MFKLIVLVALIASVYGQGQQDWRDGVLDSSCPTSYRDDDVVVFIADPDCTKFWKCGLDKELRGMRCKIFNCYAF